MNAAAREAERIREVYRARDASVADRYAPWQPGEELMRTSRRRLAARLLRELDLFPAPGDLCLEIGCGTLGWMADLIGWGLRSEDLAGIDLDAARLARARAALPGADIRLGDATALPWEAGRFRLVIVSTVLSSILDPAARAAVAAEAARATAPGGAVVVYDMGIQNPANRDVAPIGRHELERLFPGLRGPVRSLTLAPPLARTIAPASYALAELLEGLPFLRTHLLAVLVKNGVNS